MRFLRSRRALLALACLSSALIAACGGGGDIKSQFQPTRVIAFGDAFSDLGQNANRRYSINYGGADVWTQQLASRYGTSITANAAGGLSYATGSARVNARPDAAGNPATPSIKEQIDLYNGTFRDSDLVVVQGGIGDIIAEVGEQLNNGQAAAQTQADVVQAARDLATQVRRVANAGATHVLVVGPYNLGRSPWATVVGSALLENLSNRFNERLLIDIADLGTKVLYVDAAFYFNLVTANPPSYSFTDVTSLACNSVDAGPGIGTGANQVNSALCTGATLNAVNAPTTLFADRVYFTPAGHQSFGNYAYDRLRQRW